jgi:LmbE family N-acetylglucosaminyl deacetylase
VLIDPSEQFAGRIVIAIPHMDDGVLACGGTLALLPEKERVHLIYATDGMGSPAPVLPWRDSVPPDLGKVRCAEARAAMESLGVPTENIHFLDLPDGRLQRHAAELERALSELIRRIRPRHLFVPFRYDRHPDHLAVNRAVTRGWPDYEPGTGIIEYFVYHRWRLLPRGDVRTYVDARHLLTVEIGLACERKRTALEHFQSQTTRFYSWQTRPNLTPTLLDEVSRSPEVFLRYDPACPGAKVFRGFSWWIRLVHRLEPFLKVHKDRAVALLRRALRAHD